MADKNKKSDSKARKVEKADKTTEDLSTAELKSTPPTAREEASENTFAKDYLVRLPDSSKVSDEDIDRNKKDVVIAAQSRGLRTTADVELADKEVIDEHNVLLKYTVAVEVSNSRK